MPSKTGKELLPTYMCGGHGFECKTKVAIVAHVQQVIKKGARKEMIFIRAANARMSESRAWQLSKALIRTLLEKKIPCSTHGGNVIVETSIPLQEAIEAFETECEIVEERRKSK